MNTILSRSAVEALLLEKFQALLIELDSVGDKAPYSNQWKYLWKEIPH